MILSLADAANKYAGNERGPWIQFVENVLDQFFQWMANELKLNESDIGEIRHTSFSEEIYAGSYLLDSGGPQHLACPAPRQTPHIVLA
jgi:hypothetical protein